jgi:hypothetical protein
VILRPTRSRFSPVSTSSIVAVVLVTITTAYAKIYAPPTRHPKRRIPNLQTLENIKRQCFYFGGVGDFNDPFECHILPPAAKDNEESFRAIREHYAEQIDIPESVRREIRAMDASAFGAMIKRSAINTVEMARKDFTQRCGVTCFSERNENLLMWSHYSSGGAGLCLQFDTTFDVFKKARKVRYRETPPEVDAVEITFDTLLRRNPTWIDDMYCTKPIDWSYEMEWRVIHLKRGTVYCYPKECLKAVYFGPRCTRAFMETVCLIFQGQNREVSFYRGSNSHSRYAVEFEKFYYTTSADAQNGEAE